MIVLSVDLLKDIVLYETAWWGEDCRSMLYREKVLMIAEIVFISEHPSGTWDCWFGAFLLDLCYHLSYISSSAK